MLAETGTGTLRRVDGYGSFAMRNFRLGERHTLKELRKMRNRQPKWLAFLSSIEPGDEICTFSESVTDVVRSSSVSGWIALRNGQEIARYESLFWDT